MATSVSGAGYRNGDIVPCGFQSLGSFLIYWEMTSKLINTVPYQLVGVSSNTALCVRVGAQNSSQSTMGILYMAPSSVSSCWYYLQNFLGAPAGLGVGAGAYALGGYQYLAISPDGLGGNIILSGINPSMSDLTAL